MLDLIKDRKQEVQNYGSNIDMVQKSIGIFSFSLVHNTLTASSFQMLIISH